MKHTLLAFFLLLASLPAHAASRELTFSEAVRPGDRFLFVGDEITQQMFYTRQVATAVLALRPGDNLRFFNGGYSGATPLSAQDWIDDLLAASKPTVVFICLGLNADTGETTVEGRIDAYERHIGELIDKVRKASPAPRLVILMSPPAMDRPEDEVDRLGEENAVLRKVSVSAQRVAESKGIPFMDLFEYSRRIFIDARSSEGELLSINGREPSELGHAVIASLVLNGMGVTPAMLESVGWAPLKPRQMRRVRQVLAVRAKPPSLEDALRSRELYETLLGFDEKFFRVWRIAEKHRSAIKRDDAVRQAEDAWAYVRQAVAAYAK